MIDKAEFANAMSVLADRFNRPLHAATIRAYYELLSTELTGGEFQAAAQIAFRDSTFWPSPKELVEFVRPPLDLDLEGSRMFDHVLALGEKASGAAGTFYRRDRIAALGEAALAAFATIGAQERLRDIKADDLPWARREFITAFKAAYTLSSKKVTAHKALTLAASKPSRALPAGPLADAVSRVVESVSA